MLPDISLTAWQPTRDAVWSYAKLLGRIRRALVPAQKHWWHISLHVSAAGLTTTPIVTGERAFELVLSLSDHCLHVVTNLGERKDIPLHGQSPAAFYGEVMHALGGLGIKLAVERDLFADDKPAGYDKAGAARFWQVLPRIDAVFKQLKGEYRGESSPVQLWPHHFDLAVMLYTGRHVAGVDPADEESADEQMNFGFSTGDAEIPEPYFYVTAYPTPATLSARPPPAGAYWHVEDWTGCILRYESLRAKDKPMEYLLDFFRKVRDAGLALMKGPSKY